MYLVQSLWWKKCAALGKFSILQHPAESSPTVLKAEKGENVLGKAVGWKDPEYRVGFFFLEIKANYISISRTMEEKNCKKRMEK